MRNVTKDKETQGTKDKAFTQKKKLQTTQKKKEKTHKRKRVSEKKKENDGRMSRQLYSNCSTTEKIRNFTKGRNFRPKVLFRSKPRRMYYDQKRSFILC